MCMMGMMYEGTGLERAHCGSGRGGGQAAWVQIHSPAHIPVLAG